MMDEFIRLIFRKFDEFLRMDNMKFYTLIFSIAMLYVLYILFVAWIAMLVAVFKRDPIGFFAWLFLVFSIFIYHFWKKKKFYERKKENLSRLPQNEL